MVKKKTTKKAPVKKATKKLTVKKPVKKVTKKTPARSPRKGGRVPKDRKSDIMSGLASIIESGQILGVTQVQLAEKFNIRRQTISDYLKEIYASIPPEDLNSTRVKIQVMFDRLFREVTKMIVTAKDNRDKKDAIQLMLNMVDKFTSFLESFHIKDKAAENINIGVEKQLILIKHSEVIDIKKHGRSKNRVKQKAN